jgi:integrase
MCETTIQQSALEKEVDVGRRGQGEGTIYRDGDRWRGAISLGFGPDGRRLRAKVSGRTKTEVRDKLKELQRTVDSGLPAPDGRLTVGEFLDRWLRDNLRGTVEDTTADNYEDTVRLHLKPDLGSKLLTRLTVSEVDSLWQRKRAAGYKPNSIRIMRAVLQRALHQAERESLVMRNVAHLSNPAKLDAPERRSLTVTQARTLLGAAEPDRLSAAYLVMLTYGLRRGEALGLQWDDVDLDGGTIQIRRAVKRVKNRTREPGEPSTRLAIGDVKTKRSRRQVPLNEQVTQALRAHRTRQLEERLACGPGWQDTGFVFTTPIGTVVDPDNFGHYFSKLTKKAGLGHWHLHELRHSAVSIMLALDVPLHIASEVVGHSSIAITKDIYGHLLGGEKQSAANAMAGALFD